MNGSYSRPVVLVLIGGMCAVLLVYAITGQDPPPGMISLASAVISGVAGFHMGANPVTPPPPVVITAPPPPAADPAPATPGVSGPQEPPAPPGAGTVSGQE